MHLPGEVNWHKEGITLCTNTSDLQRPSLEDFHEAFDVVFIDRSGYVNLCAHLTVASLDMVRFINIYKYFSDVYGDFFKILAYLNKQN